MRANFTYENRWSDLRFCFRYDADNTANLAFMELKAGSTPGDSDEG